MFLGQVVYWLPILYVTAVLLFFCLLGRSKTSCCFFSWSGSSRSTVSVLIRFCLAILGRSIFTFLFQYFFVNWAASSCCPIFLSLSFLNNKANEEKFSFRSYFGCVEGNITFFGACKSRLRFVRYLKASPIPIKMNLWLL